MKKPSGRSFELTTTRYFVEFFGLKAADREGIRRLLAEKAGVKFIPKPPPEQGGEEAPSAEEAPAEGAAQGPPSPPPEGPGEPITGG